MAELQAFVPGIYPRSEELVQATRDLDRGRTTQEAVAEQVERDRAAFVSGQQDAAVDLLADGMLSWQDHFRPLLDLADGLETGALTRFLDTNSFYRAPKATTATPKLGAPLDESYVAPLAGPRLVTLPSPFALARGTGVTPKTMAEGVLKPAIEALDVELVVLAEPFLAREDAPSLADLAEALETLAGTPKLAIWFTFGDARPAARAGRGRSSRRRDRHRLLRDAPGRRARRLLRSCSWPASWTRATRCSRSRASWPRSPQRLGERAERIALVPNGDLQYVSEPIAREKLARLGKAKTATTEAAA